MFVKISTWCSPWFCHLWAPSADCVTSHPVCVPRHSRLCDVTSCLVLHQLNMWRHLISCFLNRSGWGWMFGPIYCTKYCTCKWIRMRMNVWAHLLFQVHGSGSGWGWMFRPIYCTKYKVVDPNEDECVGPSTVPSTWLWILPYFGIIPGIWGSFLCSYTVQVNPTFLPAKVDPTAVILFRVSM